MEKTWRIYDVVDIDTGELIKKDHRKNYKTLKIEKNVRIERGYRIETTTRIVKHNGQTEFEWGNIKN